MKYLQSCFVDRNKKVLMKNFPSSSVDLKKQILWDCQLILPFKIINRFINDGILKVNWYTRKLKNEQRVLNFELYFIVFVLILTRF